MDSIQVHRRIQVALVGPPAILSTSAYGGGIGGIVRNMQVNLGQAGRTGFDYVACYTTVRQGKNNPVGLIRRFIVDLRALLRVIRQVEVVHVLGQYRGALPRELGMVALALMFRRPCVYDIKAGSFIVWFNSTSPINRFLVSWILRHSRLLLCEGVRDVDFLQRQFCLVGHHFPNVVPASEIPSQVAERFAGECVRLLFIGYCYEGKGVFDLVRGVAAAREAGIPVELTLIGFEELSFKTFLDGVLVTNPTLPIQRRGVLGHDEVLREMSHFDVFCMPTDHPGEGHTNSINEALMMGMAILCTRHGFLPAILGESTAYYVEKRNPGSIAAAIQRIWEDRPEARRRARAGRVLLEKQYVAEPWFQWLGKEYRRLLGRP